jgi:PIN domain nuclease of toxin-antitoxin system
VRLVLDTHIALAVLDTGPNRLSGAHRHLFEDRRNTLLVSTASLWEVAIKARLGKLTLKITLEQIPEQLAATDVVVVDIQPEHVLSELTPLPPTRDPFDQLLLAVAKVEGALLVTNDAKLHAHPLAWKPASA